MAAKRKPNWTEGEKLALVEGFESKKHVLKARFSSRISFNDKNNAWEEVVAAVNAVNGESYREEMEVRKKWDNLCVWGKKMMSDWKKASNKTGNYIIVNFNQSHLSRH